MRWPHPPRWLFFLAKAVIGAALSRQSFAAQMITLLETALAANPGVVKLSIGDKEVQYDREQALAELEKYRSQNSTTARLPMTAFRVRPGAAE
jgi:hypothetical protein